ncbi:hypothetical protein EDC03_2612 [Pseudokineococcus lusitanus]|uniref:Uncharacterized protein n=1 Tax=Pseudokineococcus lusitanus TaxID=763993 RepID=A0A3N1GX25_9ACTN|nr:hypothetical protein EDC03_2612 [Pseudokineococcus lusitanus]
MKVQLVVQSAGAASTEGGWPPVGEALAGLGRTRQVMAQAWVVGTASSEHEVLSHVLTRCGDEVEVVVVRMDLGGYAAHLVGGPPLSDGWGDGTAALA